MNRLFSNLERVIMSHGSTTLLSLFWIVSAVATPRGGEYTGRVPFITILLFLASEPREQLKPVNRFPRTIAQKTQFEVRKCPLGKCFFRNFYFLGVIFPENLQHFAGSGEIPTKMKKSNNSLAVADRQNIAKKHENELGVTFSGSVIGNDVRCSLAEKSPWRHFRFARKHHYLGNNAWFWKGDNIFPITDQRKYSLHHAPSPRKWCLPANMKDVMVLNPLEGAVRSF